MTKMKVYSKLISNSNKESETGIYRYYKSINKLKDIPQNFPKTSIELFEKVVNQIPNKPYQGKRKTNANGELGPYEFETYSQAHYKANELSSGIYHLLVTNNLLSEFTPISIFSPNRPEWWIFDLACNYHSLPTVGLYDVFGPQSLIYILNHSKSPLIAASIDKLPLIFANHDKLDHLKVIVCLDSLKDTKFKEISFILNKWNNSIRKFKLIDFNSVLELGSQFKYPHHLPSPNDILTICYTSGTTGAPKGAMLSHYNFMIGSYMMCDHFKPINKGEVVSISYMPLSHCFARTCEYNTLLLGGKVGYYSGNILKLMDDIQTLKPTSFGTVPRILNRIYDSIKTSFESQKGIAGSLFKLGIYYKLQNYTNTGEFNHTIWDRLIFNKVKNLLGGNIRYITTGSAPLQSHVMHFLRVAFSCHILEGYGSTETASISTFAPIGDYRANHIGHPLPNVELKLASVPNMNYLITDKPFPRGELLVKGKMLFKGYLSQPEKSQEVFDEEGFYKTGDICSINEEGLVSIIDRKSNFFKLSQGYFISPEKLEAIISQHAVVELIFCTALNTKNHPILIIVPNLENFYIWLKQRDFKIENCFKDKSIKSKLLEEIQEMCKLEKLPGFEIPRNLYLEQEPFTSLNGLLTPTNKLCRPKLTNYYKIIINRLYEETN